MTVDAVHGESAGRRRVASTPFSHLSLELGHLYMEDFGPDAPPLRAHFERVAPWARTAAQTLATQILAAQTVAAHPGASGGKPRGRPRVSTCFLLDDYFTRFSSPAVVVPALQAAAAECDLRIDYLARESGCAEADGVPVARLVTDRLVPDPPEGTDGSRPPATETGWLCNGARSPVRGVEAMDVDGWRPPVQNAARNHSVFVDVELWDADGRADGDRRWSCAFLAAVWQLVRLGMLRNNGEPVLTPVPAPRKWPDDWDELPPVVQLNPDATPFTAYRVLSVLPGRFVLTEAAVRTILNQVQIDAEVLAQIRQRGDREGFPLPTEIIDRINYVFV